MNELEIAKEIEFNAKAEAQAVLDYTELLNKIAESELDEFDKSELKGQISEIIADELNHQAKLMGIYTALTDIEMNEN